MHTAKKLFAVAIAFCIGGIVLVIGINDYRLSRRLAAEGKTTNGKVLSERTAYRSKGRTQHYLTLAFQTDRNQNVTQEVPVDYDTHRAGASSRTATVHYLPGNPEVCQAGAKVELQLRNLIIGAIIVICGLVAILHFKKPETRKELADTAADHLEALSDAGLRYVPVDARQFKKVDQAFYHVSQRQLQQRGYVFVEDVEVVTKKPNTNFAPTFVRILVSEDGTKIATIYHLKPALLLRTLGAKESKIYGLDTQFSNSTFVSTDNAQACAVLENSPAINSAHFQTSISLETLIESHEKRIQVHAQLHPEAAPLALQNAKEIYRSMALQHHIKAAYRRQTGFTKGELERIAGVSQNKVIDNLHADVSQQREEQRKAA